MEKLTLENKAANWDRINRTAIPEHIKDVLDNPAGAILECAAIQQFIIDNIDDDKIPEEMLNIRNASQRLFKFVTEIYYAKDVLSRLEN